MNGNSLKTLDNYLTAVKTGQRRFENAYQSVARMILEGDDKIEKVIVNGKMMYDFKVFRRGSKHAIAMYEVINSLVSFVKDAAEGGSSSEMAFVLVGEPGNGKTFLAESLCSTYRQFLSLPENRKYTFRFTNLKSLSGFGNIPEAESQTYEDPMILAMNLSETKIENQKFLSDQGFTDKQIEALYKNYRPLGACSDYILNKIRERTNGNFQDICQQHLQIVPVPVSETLGTITGKYSAKDKITSSAVDLLGEESIQRLMNIADTNNPYKFDLRRGAIARVAGGGIHFSDEIFRNKKDLVQVYLAIIQNRTIEMDGYKWPIDTLIIATSNNDVFNTFNTEKEEAPIVDRCRICFMSHNTNYRLQQSLTGYVIGDEFKTTVAHDKLHIDPNLNYAASVAVTLTRLPKANKLTPVEMLKLAAGEIAGDKSIKTLAEVVGDLSREADVTKRFGQKGLGQRNLGRAMQILMEMPETNQGQCMFAEDYFLAQERVILDYVTDPSDRAKFLEDTRIAKGLYREQILIAMFNTYMDDAQAIKRDVMNYVNMIIGIDAENLGPDKMWPRRDPATGEITPLKIDETWVKSVEKRAGINTEEERKTFRTTIKKLYSQKMTIDPNYDFMDDLRLVKAVTDVRLKSDVHGVGSFAGILANQTNEENREKRFKAISTMIGKLGYCKTCAEKTIEYYCKPEDET
ncbi:MAG: serine protein kinase PrkA [bacterium]|nr:serine protein kinase PrkA [bacterium]